MLNNFLIFLNENKSYDNMLKLMYHLDTIKSKYMDNGKYLNYDINDDTLYLEYGFVDFQEYCAHNYEIEFKDNITILIGEQKGYCVMGDGDFYEQNYSTFDTIDELIKWLNL